MDEAALPPLAPADGQTRSAISRAIVQLHAEHYGKGATQAKTYLWENLVVTVLRDVLTTSERTLVRAGRAETVRDPLNGVGVEVFVLEPEAGLITDPRPTRSTPA
jgi:hypothetical protein